MGLMGTGILKGLSVTFRHFISTYAEDIKYMLNKSGVQQPRPLRRQSPKNRGMVTVEYPKERLTLPENFRYVPFLVNDTAENEIKCTSCGICAKVCPPQCIWIVRTEDPVTKRPVPQPKDFHIDDTICMNCGYCAEFCPFDAIKMDHDYELSYYPADEPHARQVPDKERLLKPDTYHASIHPTDWARELADKAAEDEKKRAAAEAKAKADAAKAAAASGAAPAADKPAEGTPAAPTALGASSIKPAGASSIKPAGASSIKPAGASSIKPAGTSSIKPASASSIKPASSSSIKPAAPKPEAPAEPPAEPPATPDNPPDAPKE
jgi:NADH-quinone oxidoreductase subunit I